MQQINHITGFYRPCDLPALFGCSRTHNTFAAQRRYPNRNSMAVTHFSRYVKLTKLEDSICQRQHAKLVFEKWQPNETLNTAL
jgi:hypothetical protein